MTTPSLISHEFNILFDLFCRVVCHFDGHRCTQTLRAATGLISFTFEYASMLKTAGMNSFCDRDQRQRCPECLFRRLGYAVRYTAEVRGSLCCSFLCPSIATDIRGYVRVDCRFGVNLSDEGGFCQKCEGKTNLALSTWKK